MYTNPKRGQLKLRVEEDYSLIICCAPEEYTKTINDEIVPTINETHVKRSLKFYKENVKIEWME